MAAVGQRYFTANPFEVDGQGVPLSGAQLFAYQTGTSIPLDTYSDVNLTTANTNPVIADGNGRFGSIFLNPSIAYKIQLWSAPTVANPTGAEIWSEDPVGPAAGGAPSKIAGIVGEVRAFAGLSSATPAGWYLCYGQAVDRTTYADGFAVLGTSWGAGNGSTTFNLPDFRGRSMFGLDNMGGPAANRVTSGISGISGITLGATGGSQLAQRDTITASTAITLTDPDHSHVLPGSVLNGSGGTPGTPPTGGVGSGGVTNENNPVTNIASTGITATATTTATSSLTGASQNMPPAGMVNMIIYLGV